MAVLDIILHPNDLLRTRCKPVEEINDDVRALIDDMAQTMYDAPGIGIAAPQVGSDLRITVIDVHDSENNEPPELLVFVNPEIIAREGSIVWEEGCLSIPGVFADVKRAKRVTVRALDRDGQPFELHADGLLSVCIQHEIDHLNGVLFLDHLSRLKLRMAMKTYKRSRATYERERAEAKAKKRRPPSDDDTPSHDAPSHDAPSHDASSNRSTDT